MVKFSNDEREGFSQRLIGCLDRHGVKPGSTALAIAYNIRSPHSQVTVHGVRKWLLGEAIPTQEKVVILANWLGVSPPWLRFGGAEFAELEGSEQKKLHTTLHSDIDLLSAEEGEVVRVLVDALLKFRQNARDLERKDLSPSLFERDQAAP